MHEREENWLLEMEVSLELGALDPLIQCRVSAVLIIRFSIRSKRRPPK
jgi:hypothetical protein